MSNPVEYRPFRRVVTAIYIAVTAYASVCVLVSSCNGAYQRHGVAKAPAPIAEVDAQAVAFCVRELDVLSTELNERLDSTLASWPARRSSVEWDDWSPAWRERLLSLGAKCRLEKADVAGTRELAEAWRRLAQLHRHYTTLAVQFSKEIGPYADGVHQAMEAVRKTAPPVGH